MQIQEIFFLLFFSPHFLERHISKQTRSIEDRIPEPPAPVNVFRDLHGEADRTATRVHPWRRITECARAATTLAAEASPHRCSPKNI